VLRNIDRSIMAFPKKINGPIRDLQKVALVLPNSPRMTNVTGKPALEHLVCQREDSE
jgi:hypothetical protein